MRQLRRSQPWIETENSPVTIDIKLFRACRPLHGLLAKGSEASGFITSPSEALADFGGRWAISSQLCDHIGRAASEALVVAGRDAEALVWREGMVVGAHEPLATTLKLLMADFSAAARQMYVHSKPELLVSALGRLSDDVKSRYVPGTSGFIEQARLERADKVAQAATEMTRRLNALVSPRRSIFKPPPDAG